MPDYGSSAGSGEANTTSNEGTGTGTLAKAKSGVNLPFKTLKEGTNITLTNNADDVTINSSGGGGGEANTASNVGTAGVGVFKQKTVVDLEFKKLNSDATITITDDTGNSEVDITRAALTGDVTASAGSNATTVANDAISFAKMQNIATDSLIGRDTAATGDPENILLNATLSMDGAGNLQRAALTGDVTASAGSNATTIANDAVTYAKMQNVSATSRLLGRITTGAGDTEELTGTQATTLLDVFTSTLQGVVPASGGGTTNFLRADGTFAAPPGAGGGEANTASNVGTGGVGVFKQKTGVDLEFKKLNSDSTITITDDTGNSEVDITRAALTGDVTASAGSNATTIANDAVTYAKMQNVSVTDRLLGRDTAAAGDVEELTVGGGIEFTGSGGIQTSAFTGDVTKSAGGTAQTIANDAVTYAKMQNVSATSRFLGRITAGAGDTEELTGTQATSLLDVAGSGTTGVVNTSAQTFGGDKTFAAGAILQGFIREEGVISPTQITANQNDYNPTNLATSKVLRLTTDASRNITGLSGGANGRKITIHNVGSFDIVLTNQDTGSTAANRFLFGAARTIRPDKSIELMYDSTTSRWRSLSGSGDIESTGTATGSADGSATVFNVAHGLGVTPFSALILISSVLGSTIDYSYTVDSTNIVVTFASAPSTGTITFHWRAVA